jgi:hypothetical protein
VEPQQPAYQAPEATMQPQVSRDEIVREQPQSPAPMAENAPSFEATAEAEPVPEAAPPAEVARAARPEPVPEPAPAPQAAPERAPAPQASAAPAVPLKLDWPSDLVQIETDPHKAKAVVVEEAPAAPRVRRVRPAPPQMPNEPLVQVETHTRESA